MIKRNPFARRTDIKEQVPISETQSTDKKQKKSIRITHHQAHIFRLWLEGYDQKEIGKELSCSQQYISQCLKIVYKKLGLKNVKLDWVRSHHRNMRRGYNF